MTLRLEDVLSAKFGYDIDPQRTYNRKRREADTAVDRLSEEYRTPPSLGLPEPPLKASLKD